MTFPALALPCATVFAVLPPASSTVLRNLKNRLHAQLPHVPSSHLSEALAAGLGYRTHAALLAHSAAIQAHRFDLLACMRRLRQLGHAPDAPFWQSPPDVLIHPTAAYRDLQTALRAEVSMYQGMYVQHADQARQIIAQCIQTMADLWDLGSPRQKPSPSAMRSWNVGVDHATALPGWQGVLNQLSWGYLRIDGGNQCIFRRALPLRDGRCVEYSSAVLSFNPCPDLENAALVAGSLGWRATHLPGWGWSQDTHTTPMLYRIASNHAAMLTRWECSFKRWLMEEQVLLKRNCSAARRAWIDGIIASPHFPWEFADATELQALQFKNGANQPILATPYQLDFLVTLLHRWRHSGG